MIRTTTLAVLLLLPAGNALADLSPSRILRVSKNSAALQEGFHYDTIQDAIDAVPSANTTDYVILVYPGVYEEEVLLDKRHVTLSGVGKESVVIEHPGVSGAAALTIKLYDGEGTFDNRVESLSVTSSTTAAVEILLGPAASYTIPPLPDATIRNCSFYSSTTRALRVGSGVGAVKVADSRLAGRAAATETFASGASKILTLENSEVEITAFGGGYNASLYGSGEIDLSRVVFRLVNGGASTGVLAKDNGTAMNLSLAHCYFDTGITGTSSFTGGGSIQASGSSAKHAGFSWTATTFLDPVPSTWSGTAVSNPSAGRAALNAVNKAGDTMTGGLTVSSGNLAATTGNVSAGGSVSAGTSVSASSNITAGGSISAGTTVSATGDINAGGYLKVTGASSRLGVRTSSPLDPLHVYTNGAGSDHARIGSTTNYVRINETKFESYRGSTGINLLFGANWGGSTDATSGMQFKTKDKNGTYADRMYLNRNGLLGIGTTSPGSPLHIQPYNAYYISEAYAKMELAAFDSSNLDGASVKVTGTGGASTGQLRLNPGAGWVQLFGFNASRRYQLSVFDGFDEDIRLSTTSHSWINAGMDLGIGTDSPAEDVDITGYVLLRNNWVHPMNSGSGGKIYARSGEIYVVDQFGTITQISSHASPSRVLQTASTSFNDPDVTLPISINHANGFIGKGQIIDLAKLIEWAEGKMQRELGAEDGRLRFDYEIPLEEQFSLEDFEIQDVAQQIREDLAREPWLELSLQPGSALPEDCWEDYEIVEQVTEVAEVTEMVIDWQTNSLVERTVSRPVTKDVATGRFAKRLKATHEFREGKLLRRRTVDDVDESTLEIPSLPDWVIDRLPAGTPVSQAPLTRSAIVSAARARVADGKVNFSQRDMIERANSQQAMLPGEPTE